MDQNNIIRLLTEEEKQALKVLCEAIVDDINGRVEMITRRKRVAPILKNYGISVNGISFSLDITEEDMRFLIERSKALGLDKGIEETGPTYFG